MKKRLLASVLAALMVVGMMPEAFAVNDNADVHVNSYNELVSAIEGATGDNYTISVDTKIEAAKPIEITKSVTLEGTSAICAADNFSGGALIELKSEDTTLTLGDITLNADEKARVIYCSAGKLIVDGATICGGKTANSYIGGVYMTNASQFVMNSGTIMNNKVSDNYAGDGYMQYSADLWIGANANGAMTAINGGSIGSAFVNSNAWSAQNPGGFTMNDGHIGNLYVEYDKGYGASFTYMGGTIESLYVSTIKGNGDKVEIAPIVNEEYKGGTSVSEAEAVVNDIYYQKAENAVVAAKDNGTVTLINDVNTLLTIPTDAVLTLKGDASVGMFANNGTVTVDDSNLSIGGEMTDENPDGRVFNSGTMNVQKGNVMGTIVNTGTLNIADGRFRGVTDETGLISINGGYFNGDILSKTTEFINGGFFNVCPDDSYLVKGKDFVQSGDEDYSWTVANKINDKDEDNLSNIKDATAKGKPEVKLSENIAEEDKNAASNAAKSVYTDSIDDIKYEMTEPEKQDAIKALAEAGKIHVDENGKIPEDVTVTIVKKVYLDVVVNSYKKDETNGEVYWVDMDITPTYDLIATTNGTIDENAVTFSPINHMMVNKKSIVTITLPEFANKKVYITHKNDIYVATADDTGKIVFTTNGFSPFTFTLTNSDVVAEVNGNAYKDFQSAVNAATSDDDIYVVNKDAEYKATATKTVKVTNKTADGSKVKVAINGDTREIENGKSEVFTYRTSSGGSSGGGSSSSSTYKVTVATVSNGSAKVSSSTAAKDATVTVTLSPDKGYKLDKITVTDASGKEIATTKKSDTSYTFTMPAAAVTVKVTYVKDDAEAEEPDTGFNDVADKDWFADAVKYVADKGMMNGTSKTTFSPNDSTTRGMIVTVLYRLENEPSAAEASFTDVVSGQYYTNAVAWANANGIVTGYGNGKFGPNDKITREQLAAILYRYAQYKGVDVGAYGGMSLREFADYESISEYARPAFQWAVSAGVVTGKTGNKIDPAGSATRAEVAAMLMRYCEKVAK